MIRDTPNAKIARASVNANEIKNFLSRISIDDGLRPTASLYDEKIIPRAIPTPNNGKIATAAANSFKPSSIFFPFLQLVYK